jgi:hypothetical protein
VNSSRISSALFFVGLTCLSLFLLAGVGLLGVLAGLQLCATLKYTFDS